MRNTDTTRSMSLVIRSKSQTSIGLEAMERERRANEQLANTTETDETFRKPFERPFQRLKKALKLPLKGLSKCD